MNTKSASTGTSTSSTTTKGAGRGGCDCDIDIRIDCKGDVNIYNCSTPAATGAGCDDSKSCEPCFPPYNACLPTVPGAKHKLSRDFKLAKLAERIQAPSSLAGGAFHMARRFLLGKAPGSPLET